MDNIQLDRQFQISGNQDDGYYHEYCRLYLANVVLTSQVRDLIEEKNQLTSRLQKLQNQDGYSSYDRNHQKSKRFRRTAHEIDRYYRCCVKGCQKSYGSEGSLNQHYKLKHPEIYVTLPNVQVQSIKTNQLEIEPESLVLRKKQPKKYNI